jgi:peptidylprolyl isomerase/peptidyl-prolyl cis-trans isomerase C
MSKTIHASHILVTNEYEAQDILRLLKDGKDFAELAKKYSKCSSAPQGGDLGVQALAKLDEDFADAASLLKPGQISTKPVRTKFGYHIIRREA